MRSMIVDIVARLQRGEYGCEEHVRLSLVCRLLQQLGWDIWNPREVNTEFVAVPREDSSHVDVAIFLPPRYDKLAAFQGSRPS